MDDKDAKKKNEKAEAERKDAEERLQEGLEDTFPASDPVSANQPTRTGEPDEHATGKGRK